MFVEIRLARRHRRTFQRMFQIPTPTTLRWDQVVSLIQALGGSVEERAGSRVAFVLNERVAVLHKPHPGNEIKRSAVRDLKAFFLVAGVEPPDWEGDST